AGDVMDTVSTINVPDVQRDPRPLPLHLHNGTRSLLVAPIESRRQRLGTISVLCKEPEIFTPDDERLLKVLGVQAGMAIENARLYAAQRRARKLAEKRRERMRHMARRLMQAQEEERARIARELHDESGQALTSLKISLDMIQMLLPDDMGDVKESLQEIVELTDKTMSSLRLLSHNLRPPGLDAYGLHAALAGLCQDYETHTNLAVSYTGVELRDVAPLLALALYRLAQEALTNVVKHAQASQAWVTLAQQGDQLVLTVTDDGQGFTPPNLEEIAPGSGDGLRGMVERLEMVSGQLEITSAPGEGVRLTAVVPLTMEES
ncbi:MAG: GAF domain-containing sensor histidine kinase, partial [Anaerolineales bacterium]|nr:GAF domain-containing sensor histidine kinase [Anaerolineales bacterium]